MRPARSGTRRRSTSGSGRAQLATSHNLGFCVQRCCECSDGPELQVDVCREETSHNRIVAADIAGQLCLGNTGVDAQVLHPLGDVPLVMAGVQLLILRIASTPRSVAPMPRMGTVRRRSRWTGYAGSSTPGLWFGAAGGEFRQERRDVSSDGDHHPGSGEPLRARPPCLQSLVLGDEQLGRVVGLSIGPGPWRPLRARSLRHSVILRHLLM